MIDGDIQIMNPKKRHIHVQVNAEIRNKEIQAAP